jgi:ATP-dependent protease HslVU (ClpYQ) peptidase subunit
MKGTCITALINKGTIWMAGDGREVSGTQKFISKQKKVFKIGPFIIGCTALSYLSQMIVRNIEILPHALEQNYFDYLIDCFSVQLKNNIQEEYVNLERNIYDDEQSGKIAGQLLVGYRGHLVEVELFGAITEIEENYMAIGDGAPFALGHLKAISNKRKLNPQDLIESIKTAHHFLTSVGPPYYIDKLKGENNENN